MFTLTEPWRQYIWGDMNPKQSMEIKSDFKVKVQLRAFKFPPENADDLVHISRYAEFILWMRPANERRRYIVTSFTMTLAGRIHEMIPAYGVSLRIDILL